MARANPSPPAPRPPLPLRFYFTLHPADLSRQRLVPGCHAMLVASSQWRDGRFIHRRPPADIVQSLALDSGGFTAARKWGQYPWTPTQYADWARRVSVGHTLDWVAVMDYACERDVNRQVHTTNQQRIAATVENAQRCLAADASLPWLPVVQGATVEDYAGCIQAYEAVGIPLHAAGLGTMCGRPLREAIAILCHLAVAFPQIGWHVFGMHLGVLSHEGARRCLQSWDSYAWDWEPNGFRGRAAWKRRRPGLPDWTYSKEVRARATAYHRRVQQLVTQPHTGWLWGEDYAAD